MGLTPETTYYFRVRVYDTGSLYKDSNTVSEKTIAAASFLWLIIGVGAIVLVIATGLVLVIIKKTTLKPIKGRALNHENSM